MRVLLACPTQAPWFTGNLCELLFFSADIPLVRISTHHLFTVTSDWLSFPTRHLNSWLCQS